MPCVSFISEFPCYFLLSHFYYILKGIIFSLLLGLSPGRSSAFWSCWLLQYNSFSNLFLIAGTVNYQIPDARFCHLASYFLFLGSLLCLCIPLLNGISFLCLSSTGSRDHLDVMFISLFIGNLIMMFSTS